jgi:hypothetical protein
METRAGALMVWCGAPRLTSLILPAARTLRLCHLGAQDIWCDEASSIDMVGPNPRPLATSPDLDSHPPIHFYLLDGWVCVVRTSRLAVRPLSTLFGLLTATALCQPGRVSGVRLSAVMARWWRVRCLLHLARRKWHEGALVSGLDSCCITLRRATGS